MYEEILGPDRAGKMHPVKELKDSGARVTLSSDWDVANVNPLVGVAHSMMRNERSISLKAIFNDHDKYT
jgi:predicted amidohydrolase YtcJ